MKFMVCVSWWAWCWAGVYTNGFGPALKKRSVKTQSQTHYLWSHATPRFTVVPDRDQGAFLDFQDREVQDREITMEQMMQGRHHL